ncbi:unnamed protein product [Echinostoma caproni]|uniref:Dus domain-containing protein n=1 Tax=Echinostoma caproni TaxID=27848 RepID=A0A183AQW5_9TREM|nr:unnamed protein product [Echinostoma caproni]
MPWLGYALSTTSGPLHVIFVETGSGRKLISLCTHHSFLLPPVSGFLSAMDILSTYQKPGIPFVRISAPMVRYTKLPFRLLLRQYGIDLAYTPMIMADSFVSSAKARDVEFTTCAVKLLIIQSRWALQSSLGSSLLRNPQRIAELIRSARSVVPRWRIQPASPNSTGGDQQTQNPTVYRTQGPFSVSAKIRVVPSGVRARGEDTHTTGISATVDVCRQLASMGVDWITLHARTPEQRSSEPAEWDLVRQLVETGIRHATTGDCLPIVLNGDVKSSEDAYHAYSRTKCSGVMVARGLLTNPRLFSTETPDVMDRNLHELVQRWLQLSTQHPGGTTFRTIHQHVYWMMESYLDRSRRLLLHSVNSFAGLVDWLEDYWHIREQTDSNDLNPDTMIAVNLPIKACHNYSPFVEHICAENH